jgi:hypothetical protein
MRPWPLKLEALRSDEARLRRVGGSSRSDWRCRTHDSSILIIDPIDSLGVAGLPTTEKYL